MMVSFLESIYDISAFFVSVLSGAYKVLHARNRVFRKIFVDQVYYFGVLSLILVIIVSFSMGLVLIYQMAPYLVRFGAEGMSGGIVSLAVTREVGPTMMAIIIAGRVGSAMCAELGGMKITQQVDALEIMSLNPIEYLVSSRVLAGMIMLPILTIISLLVTGIGGYIVAIFVFNIPSGFYLSSTSYMIMNIDIIAAIIKTIVFGFIITFVSCYKGINVTGGAAGVGKATIDAVFLSIVYIMIADMILSYLIYPSL